MKQASGLKRTARSAPRRAAAASDPAGVAVTCESLPGANRSVMPPREAIGSGGGRWVAEVTAQGAQGDADERHEPQR